MKFFVFSNLFNRSLIIHLLSLQQALREATSKNNERTTTVEKIRMEGESLEQAVAALK